MKKTLLSILTIFFFVLTAFPVLAQDVEMADTMRSDGKIYVVLGVLLIILTGIFAYLILLDRKLRRIEK